MAYKLLALLTFLALVSSQDVISLGDETMAEAIETYPVLLVKFFGPNCGHCKKMAPEYKKAAQKAYALDLPFTFAEVDATQERVIASKYEVRGYPTLMLFKNGTKFDYEGGREAQDFIDYLKMMTVPPPRLSSEKEIKEAIEENEVATFIFPKTDSEKKMGDKMAKLVHEESKVFIVENAELLSAVGESGKLPRVVIMKKFDEKKNVFEGTFTTDKLKDWIISKSTPLVRDLDQKTIQDMFQKSLPLVILFRVQKTLAPQIADAFRQLAQENKNDAKLIFSANDNTDFGKRVGDHIGLKNKDMPTIYILKPKAQGLDKYIMDKQDYHLDYNGIKAFLSDFNAKKIDVFIKSQPIPQTQGPVFMLVGKNYKKEVVHSEKDVLVKFYAPWCGHCKKVYIYIYIFI